MRTFLILLLIVLPAFIYAQLPQAINFQAIARNSKGDILAKKTVAFKLSILEGSATGTLLYEEEHADTTNAFGSLSLQIGQGKKTGASPMNFVDIPWQTGSKFLNIKLDTTVLRNYPIELGTIQLVTVPFAFAAQTLTSIDDANAKKGDILVFDGQKWVSQPTIDINGTGAKEGDVLIFDGVKWVPQPLIKINSTGVKKGDALVYNGTDWRPGEMMTIPPGTVMAFAGDANKVPAGWLLCDGRVIRDTGIYRNLYAVIKTSWGNGGSSTSDLFNIPDMRGMFLRGVDNGAGNGPNANTRIKIPGKTYSNTGDAVGSYQGDTIEAHNHFMFKNAYAGSQSGSGNTAVASAPSYQIFDVTDNPNFLKTSSIGGSETRPKNVYVNYIIKL